jgi:hypothetical protein
MCARVTDMLPYIQLRPFEPYVDRHALRDSKPDIATVEMGENHEKAQIWSDEYVELLEDPSLALLPLSIFVW